MTNLSSETFVSLDNDILLIFYVLYINKYYAYPLTQCEKKLSDI